MEIYRDIYLAQVLEGGSEALILSPIILLWISHIYIYIYIYIYVHMVYIYTHDIYIYMISYIYIYR